MNRTNDYIELMSKKRNTLCSHEKLLLSNDSGLSRMSAFSVVSETRCLKHAYAMLACRVVYTLIWIQCAVATAAYSIEEDGKLESTAASETTIEATATRDQSNILRMSYIVDIQSNCQTSWEDVQGFCSCSGFNYSDADEVVFFSLPQKPRTTSVGATYQLSKEQQLSVLTIRNSIFINSPRDLFYKFPLLKELDMRKCGIHNLSWETFLSANNLQIMLLSDNRIATLAENCFSYANKLQFLFLNNNQLNSLHANTFKGLQHLNHLDLSGNQLEQLPEGIFDELPALQQLTLSENRLRFISNDLLANNPRLHTVLLSTNQLRELGENAFRSVERLLALDVSNNAQLEVLRLNVQTGHLLALNCSLYEVNLFGACAHVDFSNNRLQELYFSQSAALEQLVLRNNSLQQLVTLQRVPRLRNLNVADNRELGELPADWQTPELQQLDLSNTGLKELPLAALRGMPQLRKLNVSVNNLSEIDPQAFQQLSQLTHFFIHKNNWKCNNLKLLMDFVILKNLITYTVDNYEAAFPGKYINEIACMPEQKERQEQEQFQRQQLDATSPSVEYVQLSDANEVEKLRREIKSVVQYFEAKIDDVSAQIYKLNKKLMFLENPNGSRWSQLSIVV